MAQNQSEKILAELNFNVTTGSELVEQLANVARMLDEQLFCARNAIIDSRVAETLRALTVAPASESATSLVVRTLKSGISNVAPATAIFQAGSFASSVNSSLSAALNCLNIIMDIVFDDDIRVAESNSDAETLVSVHVSLSFLLLVRLLCVRLVWTVGFLSSKIAPNILLNPDSGFLDLMDRVSDHLAIFRSSLESDNRPEMMLALDEATAINNSIIILVRLNTHKNIREESEISQEMVQSLEAYTQRRTTSIQNFHFLNTAKYKSFVCWVLGNLKYCTSEFESAQRFFELAIKSCGLVVPPKYCLNQIACNLCQQKKYQTALIYFQAALEQDPEYLESLIGIAWILRILNHKTGERTILIQTVKKIISRLQTISTPDAHNQSYTSHVFMKSLRLACLLQPSDGVAMLSTITTLAKISPHILSEIHLQSLRRVLAILAVDAQNRRRARAYARVLLITNKWDIVAAIVVGRCAVLGKKIWTRDVSINISLDEAADVEDIGIDNFQTTWNDSIDINEGGEEENYGEESFSVGEAEGVLEQLTKLLQVLNHENESDKFVLAEIITQLQMDKSISWILNDRKKILDLLTETYINLSIIKWMLGKYHESLAFSKKAFQLSPKLFHTAHNYSLILRRLGNLAESAQVWINFRIPQLKIITDVTGKFRKEFWVAIGKKMVANGSSLVESFDEIAKGPYGSIVVEQLWVQTEHEREKDQAGTKNLESKWLDLSCIKVLCEISP